jgi:hypothetical protein
MAQYLFAFISLGKPEETGDIPGLGIDAENFLGQPATVCLNGLPFKGSLTICEFNLFLCHIR